MAYLSHHTMAYLFVTLVMCLSCLKAQIILDFEIREFLNPKGLTKQNKACETFSRIDKCDPHFTLCLSSNNGSKCNILRTENQFKNKDKIAVVFKEKIKLKSIPKRFNINLNVTDLDSFDAHDTINAFQLEISPLMNDRRIGYLKPDHDIEDQSVQYQFIFRCDTGYSDDNCEPLCYSNGTKTSCLMKICSNHCDHGSCNSEKINSSQPVCECHHGWQGINCSQPLQSCRMWSGNNSEIIADQCVATKCPLAAFPGLFCLKLRDSKVTQVVKESNIVVIIIVLIALTGLAIMGFLGLTLWKRSQSRNRYPQTISYFPDDCEHDENFYLTLAGSQQFFEETEEMEDPEGAYCLVNDEIYSSKSTSTPF